MRGVFDDKEIAETKLRSDTELTLGVGTLLVIFFGLVLVCGLCFGLGYTVGHRGGESTTAAGQQPAAGTQTSLMGNGSLSKPSATAQGAVSHAAQSAPSEPAAAPALPTTGQQASNPAATQSTASGQPQVRPALPPATGTSQSASASSTQAAASLGRSADGSNCRRFALGRRGRIGWRFAQTRL